MAIQTCGDFDCWASLPAASQRLRYLENRNGSLIPRDKLAWPSKFLHKAFTFRVSLVQAFLHHGRSELIDADEPFPHFNAILAAIVSKNAQYGCLISTRLAGNLSANHGIRNHISLSTRNHLVDPVITFAGTLYPPCSKAVVRGSLMCLSHYSLQGCTAWPSSFA